MLWLSLPQACSAAVSRCQTIDGSTYKHESANLVSISDGQYLISMDGDRKDQSFIITPFLVIRSASATVLVQVSGRCSQVAVLSGAAIVKNLQDRHIVELHKGTVYSAIAMGSAASTVQQQAGRFEPISDPASAMPLFQSAKCHSSLSALSPPALSKSRFANLVADTPISAGSRFPDIEIISPPTVVSYRIGEQLTHSSSMPTLLRQHFPPDGLVSTPASLVVADESDRQ